MKKLLTITAATALLVGCANNDANTPKIDKEGVISALSVEDKARLIIGTGMAGFSGNEAVIGSTKSLVPGAAGTTYPFDSLGVPAIVLADGPAGLRIDAKREGDSATYYCTHFPIGTLLASTWNEELVEQVGKAMGEEVKEYGADVLLAPALNIHRGPLNGRNFEYYSEDPLIAGKTAAAYVRGIQSNDVGTSIKHFAGNNQETNRMANDAHISQRALREIYLKPFEIAVKESQPWTVMTSYNFINGIYTSENKDLLETILRDEWGYQGTVMTDWFGGADGAKQVWAGNDMLQPGRDTQFTQIVDAVKNGTLKEEDVNRNVSRILSLIEKTPRYKGYKYSNKPDLKAHAQVTRQSALEGMVLLKNEGTLPLAEKQSIGLYGCTSYDFIAGGTGSGNVNHAYVVSLTEGLENAGYKVDEAQKTLYTKYISEQKAAIEAERSKMGQFAMFMPMPLVKEIVPADAELKAQVEKNDLAVITIGRLSGEFLDRSHADFSLSTQERQLMEKVCSAYHAAGKKVVVLLNIGGVIETASWRNLPDAILCAWQAGQEGGNSVVDILSGKQSPSGKLTMSWPLSFEDTPSAQNFPVDLKANVNIMTGNTLKSEIKNVDYTNYEEDIYVGYRYYDSFGKEVAYPFGYGLSYTTFEYGKVDVNEKNGVFTVKAIVKNTGKVAGKEVVELYVAAPNSKASNKPEKELRAFAKTKSLEPGEETEVVMTFKASDLASYDTEGAQWKVDEGMYEILVAASATDIRQKVSINVKGSTEKVNDVMKPSVEMNLLKR
ncbi:MAG: glycoside hydrolase family 3 N-terminal domain-containing protein [Prevotellaceae bacterium]|nr:glycoside hydrolase family 3 N-terminal domain-containing protein [Prevotellaceae bacterium]